MDIRLYDPECIGTSEDYCKIECDFFVAKQDRDVWNKSRDKKFTVTIRYGDDNPVIVLPAYNRDNIAIFCLVDKNNLPAFEPKMRLIVQFHLDFHGERFDSDVSEIWTGELIHHKPMTVGTINYYRGNDEVLGDEDLRHVRTTQGVTQMIEMPTISNREVKST